jgi:hypothetical protein
MYRLAALHVDLKAIPRDKAGPRKHAGDSKVCDVSQVVVVERVCDPSEMK